MMSKRKTTLSCPKCGRKMYWIAFGTFSCVYCNV